MTIKRTFLVLGVTLAAATSVLVAGCGSADDTPPASLAKATVGAVIDDSVVTAKVKSALLADANIKSFDLKVETRKGAVQLSGFVENQDQIERAFKATRAVPGVTSVENAITLKSGSATVGNTVDDSITTTRVKSALLADPGVKSFDIGVVTRKGEVQLSGFVDNAVQVEMAIALVGKVEGVTRVVNQLSIKQ